MRIVVIGATGHIGTWLVPRLVRAGHDVMAVSRGARAPYHASDEWQSARHVMLDREKLEGEARFGESIAELSPEVVIDLISFDVPSTEQIVDALRNTVSHFIHCGTLWVHGNPHTRPYDETSPREPFGDYGIRKAAIEQYLLGQAAEGFPATLLHPGHITGPGWNPINPAGNLDMSVFEKLRDGGVVTLPDDGSATLQHVHADDVAQAFELAVERPSQAIGESFHVAARLPVSMRDYAEEAARWFGQRARLEYMPWEEWRSTVSERDAALTNDHMQHSPFASIEKARRLLGFEPRYSAVEAAKEAVMRV
jgi:nucleoside-diphosphate-sugar epimerase